MDNEAQPPTPGTAQSTAAPASPNEPSDNVIIAGAFLEYFKSDKGHEVLTNVVGFFKEWRGQSVTITKHSVVWATISRLVTLGIVLGFAVYVTVTGKMEPVIAGLLGTLAGYVLGQKPQ
jgi:hypothetical protein